MRYVLVFALLVSASLGAEERDYDLLKDEAPTLAVKQSQKLSLTILPHAGSTLLPHGPLMVRLTGVGVTPDRAIYRRQDAIDPRAEAPRFELGVTRTAGTPARLSAQLTFYLCKKERCRPIETEVSWSF